MPADLFSVAAVTKDGGKILASSHVDEPEVRTFMSSIGMDILKNYPDNCKVSADIEYFLDMTSLPEEVQSKLGIKVGGHLKKFRQQIESLKNKDQDFVLVTTYRTNLNELLANVLRTYISQSLQIHRQLSNKTTISGTSELTHR